MSVASNDLVNEDEEWEWYEEDEENAESKPTNAETIFAQRKRSIVEQPAFNLNQVQALVAEITTKPNAEPVWQTTERILSPLYEMANVSCSSSSSTLGGCPMI